MLRWILRNRLAAFERTYGYDVSYAREILDADVRAFLAYARLSGLSGYRKDVPKPAYWAAKVVAAAREDCGPCTQLVVTMALRDGVAPGVLAAALAGDDAALPEDARLGVAFARAALAHAPAADDLRDAIVARWGRRGLVSLAFALAASRVFPTLKYALGHGQACQRVLVGGQPVEIARAALGAGAAAG